MNPKRNYTVQQFADAFNVSRSSLYRMWQRHEGPQAMHVGRRTLIPVEAAEAWAANLAECRSDGRRNDAPDTEIRPGGSRPAP